MSRRPTRCSRSLTSTRSPSPGTSTSWSRSTASTGGTPSRSRCSSGASWTGEMSGTGRGSPVAVLSQLDLRHRPGATGGTFHREPVPAGQVDERRPGPRSLSPGRGRRQAVLRAGAAHGKVMRGCHDRGKELSRASERRSPTSPSAVAKSGGLMLRSAYSEGLCSSQPSDRGVLRTRTHRPDPRRKVVGMHRPSAASRRFMGLVLTTLTVAALVTVAPSAGANVIQGRIVNPNPANFTPNVLDGEVYSFVQIGNEDLRGREVHPGPGGDRRPDPQPIEPVRLRRDDWGHRHQLRTHVRQHREVASGRPRRQPARGRLFQRGQR